MLRGGREMKKLTDLNCKIIHVMVADGKSKEALIFDCPKNCGFQHLIPYSDEGAKHDKFGGVNVWQRIGGRGIYDISLAPSYISPIKNPHLHVNIKNGELVDCA
jgi:hypothetical protein